MKKKKVLKIALLLKTKSVLFNAGILSRKSTSMK